ncbi:MAG TPA: thioredoxin domain-containing protein [Candidatus Limnocylindrales bacterium]|nr:thioredoxin domain-containing protein [Candidatus Limnocylindrales bacterium]
MRSTQNNTPENEPNVERAIEVETAAPASGPIAPAEDEPVVEDRLVADDPTVLGDVSPEAATAPATDEDGDIPAGDPGAGAAFELRRLRQLSLGLAGALLFVSGLAIGLLVDGGTPSEDASISLVASPPAGTAAASAPVASAPVPASGDAPATLVDPPVPVVTLPQQGMALGSAEAPLTLEVWADYQCPYCRQMAVEVEPWLQQNYIAPGKVRLVYRDLAFLGPESLDAAVVARYAATQGKFWEMHGVLYGGQGAENQGAFSRERLVHLATLVGLDPAGATAAFDDPDLIAAVKADLEEGAGYGIASTPTLRFPDGTLVTGIPKSAAEFAATLDAAIAVAASPAP